MTLNVKGLPSGSPATGVKEYSAPATTLVAGVPEIVGELSVAGFTLMENARNEMGAAAVLGPWLPDTIFEEIRKSVRGYAVPAPVLATGGAAQTMPVNGRIPVESRPDLVHSDHNGLFASGTLGRYSKVLNSEIESRSSRGVTEESHR